MAREYSSTSETTSSNSFQGIVHQIRKLSLFRKAKDYTSLYGKSLDAEDSSLTRHLKNAFVEGCRELTLDETTKLMIAASFWTAK